MQNSLANFFSPRGVAIIGASSNPEKLSHGILKNMVQYGYTGGIYPVNPGSTSIEVKNPQTGSIHNLACYTDVSLVPDPVDLAVIVLPAKYVLQVVENCGKRGIKDITIISGGFKEAGEEGISREKELLAIAEKYNIRLIGPNCVGTVDLYSGLNTTFIHGLPARGPIGFLSQSGAIIGGVIDYIIGKGGGFSKIVSMGNEADVTETDMLEFLGEDPFTKVIAMYIEEIKEGQRFIEVASKVNRKKPIVILKAGNSEAGARAISSHTGSLAGSKAAYQAAFAQTGVLIVDNVIELFNLAIAFSHQPAPAGNRIAVVTNAGGLAALASDSLSSNNLKLADFSQETKDYLSKNLNQGAQVDNPIDLLGGGGPAEYEIALNRMIDDPGVDAIYALLVPHALINPEEIAEVIGKVSKTSNKPILSCIMGDRSLGNAIQILDNYQVPMFTFPELGGKLFRMMSDYTEWKKAPPIEIKKIENIDKDKANLYLTEIKANNHLSEYHTRPILDSYGIPIVPGYLAKTAFEAGEIAEKIGFPVVLKIVSMDILHKSDLGGIRLNIVNKEQAITESNTLLTHIKEISPEANIDGILVESMAPKGEEVIIGMKRDPNFGPMIMFGMGGIFVELFNDVSFGVLPLDHHTVMKMIQKTKAGKLLRGIRGKQPGDISGIVDVILRISQLAVDLPEITELEINPLLVLPERVIALDSRAIMMNE